ncbi:MORN repeat-containing protein [Leptospira saintgironsiae]|uniref:MORN repeat-containing protein n=1 Tax=Leptospira saintgironsiae TaxID=2023183 RepID=UPI000C298827|nr:hypothetical protein [Leptospira saintgironsiae]
MIIRIFHFFNKVFLLVRESFVFKKIISFYTPFSLKRSLGSFAILLFLVGGYYRIFDDAVCLEGNCKDSLSKIQFRNGDIYQGTFVDSKPQGFGAFWSRKGDYYQGSWFRGMKHGKGKYVYPNGTEYVGDFTFNKKEGTGIFKWADGSILEGSWIGDHPQGQGVLSLPGSRKFIGYYQKGSIYDGEGVFIYSDGSKYLGSWKAGMRHGFGVLVAPGGIVLFRGMWENDQKVPGSQPFDRPGIGSSTSVDKLEEGKTRDKQTSKTIKKKKGN